VVTILIALLATVAGVALIAYVLNSRAQPGGGTGVRVPQDDLVIGQAQIEARATFDRFEASFDEKGPADHFLKVPIATGTGSFEHIWVENLSRNDTRWQGTLANDPIDLKDMKMGSPVEFDQADIEDWLVVGPDSRDGGFTISGVLRHNKKRQ
jgi:uncharacterized protein YegJ (DUF2314 family)